MRLDRGCTKCCLCQDRNNVVGPSGDLGSKVALVGEAPGEKEDQMGRPFIGRAGKMLDRLMLEAGLDREKVMITNTVKCRPPGNRRPKPEEVAACHPFLEQELEDKDLIVCLGKTACEALMQRSIKMGEQANKPTTVIIMGKEKELLPAYHPSASLYNLKARDSLRETLRTVRERL